MIASLFGSFSNTGNNDWKHKIMRVCKKRIEFKYMVFHWLWLIILFPKPIQLFVFFVIAVILVCQNGFSLGKSPVSFAMLLLFSVHLFAVFFNVALLKTEMARIPAAINTMLLWPITAIYVAFYQNAKTDILIIGKYCTVNLIILFFPAIIAAFMFYGLHWAEYSLFGNPLFVTTYLNNRATIKFMGFNDFSNMNLFFIMINLMMAVPFLKTRKKQFVVFVVVVAAFEVFLIHSRAGIVLFTASAFFCLIGFLPKRHRKLVVIVGVLFGILILIIALKWFFDLLLSKIIYGNTSSTEYRVDLLKTSILEAWRFSPIWGMGIKRVFRPGEAFVAYLGSHSTYVGFFYKTGFLGVLIGLYIFAKSNWNVFKHLKKSDTIRTVYMFLLCFIVLLAIEDIDGTNWSIVVYFSSLGVLSKKKGTEREETYCGSAGVSDLFASIPSDGV